jgi:type IV secretory pathway TrbF-like protein
MTTNVHTPADTVAAPPATSHDLAPTTTPSDTAQPVRIPPTGYEFGEPRRRYVEVIASLQVMNTYLKVAVLGLVFVAVALTGLAIHTQRTYAHVKPLVIRIDEVGRAAAVSYDRLTYAPQAPELRYFLTQFVVKHYSRVRATVRQQYAESLYFLDGRLADATMQANARSGLIEKFLASGGDETEVRVRNVVFEDLRQAPFRATVDFDLVRIAPSTGAEVRRDTYVAHLVFVLQDQVDNARIPINPLGLTITYLREDQAFVADQPSAEQPR